MGVSSPSSAGSSLDFLEVRREIEAVLEGFLTEKADAAVAACLPGDVPLLMRDFVSSGGKRIRPLLCVIGWYAAEGRGDTGPVIRAAASLEMSHASALVHDDVMDASDTRRGQPTVHRAVAARHADRPDAEEFGRNVAILIGDVAFAWSAEMLHNAGLAPDRLVAALRVVDRMRTGVGYGQYLDLLAQGRPTEDCEAALKIVRHKTAWYTCESPLHLGAALAGAEARHFAALTAYAVPLGEAFQLRDDLLGVFGEVETTGKPCLDDLRSGKHTVLLALALQRGDPGQRTALKLLVGKPALAEDDAALVRGILTATGARDEVEHMIGVRREQAQRALDEAGFPPIATDALRRIAELATERKS
ncbi:polyprenyl synthetase family protein [Streptomyces sp. NPDC057555]|uniref:polyprenyl synthetase family protein n=1 Tax=Streptomyces sp. NPDC057555 TaxID=3346166 RepID=UPI0036C365F4